MKSFAAIITAVLITLPFHTQASQQQSATTCKAQAVTEAKKLLAFYRDNDDRADIDNNVTPLPRMRNPENRAHYFDVLQVWGTIYKGKYRMRFLFLSDCTLMGEEILEYANP